MIEVNGWLIEKALRPLFRKFSLLGNKVFFDNEDFPITKVLEDKYPIIKGEFEKMQDRLNDFAPFQEMSPDQIYISNDDKWKMFFLKAGKIRFERNCQEFPETMKIIESEKNLISAYFSVIGPRKMLMPHEGPWCGILRIHLGLQIPTEGKGCTLVVNQQEYRWEEGKAVVFDDTYEHIAVNMTDRNRIVLFLDYMRPLPWPLNWLNHFVVYMARFLPYFKIPIQRHKEWEKKFYGEAA
ncbi:MAG: aspartyl beta-hydroxylase [Kiritimatiellaceae bacterium]|nr:aspartyl beta-hydroxylase [Kiritimatiellaceae bacterium]